MKYAVGFFLILMLALVALVVPVDMAQGQTVPGPIDLHLSVYSLGYPLKDEAFITFTEYDNWKDRNVLNQVSGMTTGHFLIVEDYVPQGVGGKLEAVIDVSCGRYGPIPGEGQDSPAVSYPSFKTEREDESGVIHFAVEMRQPICRYYLPLHVNTWTIQGFRQ